MPGFVTEPSTPRGEAHATSSQYGYAARDLQHAAAIAPVLPADGGAEQHEAWMARLKRQHGRKRRFWELVGDRS